jgi:hypothetical protein
MQTLRLEELIPDTVDPYGALDFDQRREGIGPRRLPAWTRPQLPQQMEVMVRMPSGVRLRFDTDAPRVGIGFLATNMVTPPSPRRPVTFNLEIEGRLLRASSTLGNTIFLDPERPGEFELERGEPDTLWFEDLGGGDKSCELWLPQNAFVELRELVIDEGASIRAPAKEARPRWVHYGSSISHCMEAEQPAHVWPAVAARHAGVALQSLGFAGQCHLDQFVARTIRDADADIVSIKTGINVINLDSMRERVFAPALHGFLDTIREGKPDVPIVLVSPIFCPSAEDHPGPTVPDGRGKYVTIKGSAEIREGCMTLRRVREIIAEVVAMRQGGDAQLHYVDGLELFGEGDADDLPDDLHPNSAGYVRMGERFAKRILGSLAATLSPPG